MRSSAVPRAVVDTVEMIGNAIENWRRPEGDKLSPRLIEREKFDNGINLIEQTANIAS